MAFSGAVKLADLDDYLAPSQSCVKPLLKPKDGPKTEPNQLNKGPSVLIEVDDVGLGSGLKSIGAEFGQIKTDSVKKTATVSLNDCLACSGCVTSAETVLITQQSTAEFFAHVGPEKATYAVVSISPQSLTALAAQYNLTLIQTAKRLTQFFTSLGVKRVIDTSFALSIALRESREEFVQRFKNNRAGLPMLSGECPGWICYAEKTQPEALPYISSTKSPQQIMGTFLKKHFTKSLNIRPDQLYHVAIMPCYDKKLEASRDDFFDSEFKTREVDCVLTTGEVQNLLTERGVDFASLPEHDLDNTFWNVSADGQNLFISPDVGASGGYTDNIFRYAAKTLFGQDVPDALEYKVGKNPDIRELTLEVNNTTVLRFALAYGFRNIQNLVRTLKRNKSPYDFVEVMACPSGCLNGGGQIRIESKDQKVQKEFLQRLDEIYHSRQMVPVDQQQKAVSVVYGDWLQTDQPNSDKTKTALHTVFHAVEKQNNPLGIKW